MQSLILRVLFLLIFSWISMLEGKLAKVRVPDKHIKLLKICEFPDEIPVEIIIEDAKLNINLVLNHQLTTYLPVYVMTNDNKLIQEDLDTVEPHRSYKDKNKVAAIVITCYKDNHHIPYTLEGKITHEDKIYSLNPGTHPHLHTHRHPRDTSLATDNYILTHPDPVNFIDSHIIETEKLVKAEEEQLHRSKRAIEKEIFLIDVLLLTDYTIYNDWYKRTYHPHAANKRLEALGNIRKYYTVAYNWVALIYENFPSYDYTLTVNLIGFVISETAATSPWTEPSRRGNKVWGMNVLLNMQNWLENTDNIPGYDHVQIFSRLDFTEDEALNQIGNKGKSYIGSMCADSRSVSYVEELGGFNSADIAAHELGHSFGANHDGFGNWCPMASTKLMAVVFNPNIARSNVPSDCTLFEIKRYMFKMKDLNPECMYESLTPASDVPKLKTTFPGIAFEADEQCRQVYGSKSFYCRNAVIDDPNDFCFEEMQCFNPATESCATIVPALGTPCANKSWCMDTQCAYDDRAPERDSSCLFGDLPHGYYELTDSGESCKQTVSHSRSECYDEFFRSMCCASCGKIKNEKSQGCEYGDKQRYCYPFLCGRRVYIRGKRRLYDTACCKTCSQVHQNDLKPLPWLRRKGRRYRRKQRKERRRKNKRKNRRKRKYARG